jgi:phosphorylcholine metabolism protein LicD
MRMYENTDTNYYASFEPSINKYIFDKNTIFPLKKIELNGKYYNVVNNLPKYLELIYGSDYMVPKKYDK